jgi:hypothetical protein
MVLVVTQINYETKGVQDGRWLQLVGYDYMINRRYQEFSTNFHLGAELSASPKMNSINSLEYLGYIITYGGDRNVAAEACGGMISGLKDWWLACSRSIYVASRYAIICSLLSDHSSTSFFQLAYVHLRGRNWKPRTWRMD